MEMSTDRRTVISTARHSNVVACVLLRTGFLGSFDNATAVPRFAENYRGPLCTTSVSSPYTPPRHWPRPSDYNKILSDRDHRCGESVFRSRSDVLVNCSWIYYTYGEGWGEICVGGRYCQSDSWLAVRFDIVNRTDYAETNACGQRLLVFAKCFSCGKFQMCKRMIILQQPDCYFQFQRYSQSLRSFCLTSFFFCFYIRIVWIWTVCRRTIIFRIVSIIVRTIV